MAGEPVLEPVCWAAIDPATMASARALAVILVFESKIGGFGFVVYACSCATIAARPGRNGMGAGRGLRRGSVLVCI